jgi:hypothetical protein
VTTASPEVRLEIFALASDHPDPPLAAMQALLSRGQPVVPAVIEAIRADELGGVALGRLLEILAELDPDAAEAAALGLLNDPRHNVAHAALRTLALVGTPIARRTLREIASGPDADAAAHARILLGE